MFASSLRFSTAHAFYALSLTAASTALFGALGLPIAAFILLIWWQLLCGIRREQICESPAVIVEPQSLTRPKAGARVGKARMELAVAALVAATVIGMILPTSSDTDPMQHAEVSMRMIAKAMQTYHQEHGRFPPPIVYDATGAAMHSWRALILPQLGEQNLFAAYRMDEPWNGPNNARLSQYRPWHYQLFYPGPRQSEQASSNEARLDPTTAIQVFGLDDPGHLLLVEHESCRSHWLEPVRLEAEDWAKFQQQPGVGEGFWHQGFFTSQHRGRLAVSQDCVYHLHPHADLQPPTPQGTLPERPMVMGSPTRVVHTHNALRLAAFLFVALYPIRWIKQMRAAMGG